MNTCPVEFDTARYMAGLADEAAKESAKIKAIAEADKTAFFGAYRNLLANSEDFATCLIERHWSERYGKDNLSYVRANLAVHEHIEEELGRMWERGEL